MAHFEGVSTRELMVVLANATAARAERLGIALAVAAENTLCSARQDFGIPEERLPSRSELTLMASALAQA